MNIMPVSPSSSSPSVEALGQSGPRRFRILEGDALATLRTLPAESVHCCVTSPPYWGLRDYGVAGQMGSESTPEAFVAGMVAVFSEVRRVLRSDGTCWVNLGDSYASGGRGDRANESGDPKNPGALCVARPHSGLKPKDLVGIPWRVAFALQDDGWYLRSDIIWSKPNPMPESVTDRPTKAHEYLFLLSKSERYFYDANAIREKAIGQTEHDNTGSGYAAPGQTQQAGNRKLAQLQGAHGRAGHDGNGMRMGEKWNNPLGRNKRTVWSIATEPFPEAHFATFPTALVEPCILAGSPEGGVVLDPFAGSGTTGLVALRHDREFIGIELNPEYARMARNRILNDAPMFNEDDAALAQPLPDIDTKDTAARTQAFL